MHRKQQAVKLLGISLLAALGLVVTIAPAAQAGNFRIEGGQLGEGKSAEMQGSIGASQFAVWGIGLQIKCESGHLEGKIISGGKLSAKIVLLACTVVGSKFCKLYPTAADMEAETNAGQITSASAGEMHLHSGAYYAKFASENFNTVYIGGAACTLPEEMVASGSVAMAIPEATTEMVTRSYADISSETEALLGVNIACAGESASILGSSGTLSLVGAHAGKKWSYQ
jgi:hypothetical protein